LRWQSSRRFASRRAHEWHFTREKLADRRKRAVELIQKRGLDGLLMFRQESMFCLTGYDTFATCSPSAFISAPMGA
jgi:Xaa-Pro aminopeptidase